MDVFSLELKNIIIELSNIICIPDLDETRLRWL